MKRSSLAVSVGLVLIATGLIWVLQGLDVSIAPRSFMTDDHWWVVWGIVAISLGALAIWRSKNR
jgi:hypothetical protein